MMTRIMKLEWSSQRIRRAVSIHVQSSMSSSVHQKTFENLDYKLAFSQTIQNITTIREGLQTSTTIYVLLQFNLHRRKKTLEKKILFQLRRNEITRHIVCRKWDNIHAERTYGSKFLSNQWMFVLLSKKRWNFFFKIGWKYITTSDLNLIVCIGLYRISFQCVE